MSKAHWHHNPQNIFAKERNGHRHFTVTGALITGAVVAGAGSAVASNMASSEAHKEAEAQQEWQNQQYAPAKELERLQLQQYKDITIPYQKDIYNLWKDYGKSQTEEQYKIFQEQGLPAERELATQINANLKQPLSLPQDVWDKIWQQAREKTLSQYPSIERKTSQRLAATGGLGSGPAATMFKDIELNKAKSIETLAIDQAISEWNEKKSAQQLAYENVFKMLGYTPSTTTPSTPTSAVGTIQPYTKIPSVSSGIGEGLSTALRFADLFPNPRVGSSGVSNITNNQYALSSLDLPTSGYGLIKR